MSLTIFRHHLAAHDARLEALEARLAHLEDPARVPPYTPRDRPPTRSDPPSEPWWQALIRHLREAF
jgi:hypothetical protein